MAKILNLDALGAKTEKRKLVLGGKEYVVEEMSVENFIVTTRKAQKLIKDGSSLADQVEASVEMIKRSIPTIHEDILRGMPLEVLSQITSFVRGDEEPEAEVEAVAVEGQPEAGK